MSVDYNSFAKTFAASRKNMKWPEIEYFFSLKEWKDILDIWCGSGRLIDQYTQYFWLQPENYIGIDLSSWLIWEAKKLYLNHKFIIWNMLECESLVWDKKFDNIFLIASFHHLEDIQSREKMLQSLYNITLKGWKIYMTNWALESSLNLEKYKDSKISKSQNKYWSSDFNIKIWENTRFYHSFSLREIKELSSMVGFTVLENRIFDNERNIITILQK